MSPWWLLVLLYFQSCCLTLSIMLSDTMPQDVAEAQRGHSPGVQG